MSLISDRASNISITILMTLSRLFQLVLLMLKTSFCLFAVDVVEISLIIIKDFCCCKYERISRYVDGDDDDDYYYYYYGGGGGGGDDADDDDDDDD